MEWEVKNELLKKRDRSKSKENDNHQGLGHDTVKL